ncbi:hypothetical protein G6F56_013841 [Rhizopus delemar]|nr:hypothetical protein G6F56_013841 [Rhizopus delemar]
MKTFTLEQVAEHNKADDIWVIIDGKVFDLTKFINEHPGGKKVLLKKAGKDASKEFKTFHNPAIMQRVGLPMQIGIIGTEAKQDKPQSVATVKPQAAVTPQISHDLTRFGEGIPYGDPTWYQDWNR